MIIKKFVESPIENNNYLLIDEVSKEAALIDCSDYDEKVKQAIEDENAKLKYILITHGHFDHILGLKYYKDVEVLMHENDVEQILDINTYLPMFNIENQPVPEIHRYIKDGEIIKLGDLDIKVIHTPGHTQGGVCYLVQNVLFSGDTIFKSAVGRCDLPGGDFEQIVESIKTKIFTLPDETVIYPGHGSDTTVAWEKEHNKFM